MKNTRIWPTWACLALLLPLFPIWLGAVDDAIPLDPAVRTGTLPNGLTYYIRKNGKPEKRVELRLAVNAGSVLEDEDQLGMAHLVEHMCFRGTKTFHKTDLLHYLQSVGAGFGPDINAQTGFDETIYKLTLPSDSEEILNNGLKIMRDWAHDVNFDDDDIDLERGVVLEEWRLGRGANQRMLDKFLPVIFKGSKYGLRNPIGTKEAIMGSTHDAIKRFYRDWYRPDLIALIVVGDIDPDKVEQTIRVEFGQIPTPSKLRPKEPQSILDNTEPLYSIVSDKENPYNILLLAFKSPVEIYRTQADYRRYLTERLFIELMNRRLSELMQQANPPFVYVRADHGPMFVRAADAYLLTVVVAENGVDRGLEAAMRENERVHQYGFTAAELEREKKVTLKSLEERFHEKEKTESANLVNQYVGHFLRQDPAPGIDFEYEFARQHLTEIALDDVNRLTQEWIKKENRVVVSENTEKAGVVMPTQAELQGILAAIATTKVEPYSEKRIASSLLSHQPMPGEIVGEKQIEAAGVTEIALSNGVRVVLKPSRFKNDEVRFSAYRAGGQSVFPDDFNLSAEIATDYVEEAGVADFSKIDLQKMLAGKTVTVVPQITTYFDGLKGRCSVVDLETALQLTHLYFTQPRRDQEAFDSLVHRQKAILKNVLSNPMNAFFNDAEDLRYNHHPRNPNVLPTDKDWETVTLDKVMQVYRTRFASAADYTFIFVGAFDLKQIKPLLQTYVGSLPSNAMKESWRDMGLRSISGPVDWKILHGTDPKSMMLISTEVPTDWSRDEGHVLWSLGNIIERRLIDKLREELGAVYYVQVNAGIEEVPYAHASIDLQIPCSPDNVEKLMAAVNEDIRKIQKGGLTPQDVQKEVESQRRRFEKDAQDNVAWTWKLEKIYKDGESMTRLTDPEELVRLVTADNLQRSANKYLDTEKWVRFTLYPQTK